jgi:hypothetical protein
LCDPTDASRRTQHGLAGGSLGTAGMSIHRHRPMRRVSVYAPSERLLCHGCPTLAVAAHQRGSRPSGSYCSGANGTLRRKLSRTCGNSSSVSGRQPQSLSFFSAGVAGGPAARQGPSESLAKRPPTATPTDPHKARVTGNRQSTRPTTYTTASPSHGRDPAGPGRPGYGRRFSCNARATIAQ